MWGSLQKRKKMKVVEERSTTQQSQHTTTRCGLRKRERVTRRNSKQEYERVRKKEKKKVNTRRIKHEKDSFFCLLTNGLSTTKNVYPVIVSLDTDRGLLLCATEKSLVHAFGLQCVLVFWSLREKARQFQTTCRILIRSLFPIDFRRK